MFRALTLTVVINLLFGCSVESMVQANDDRYTKPGALDSPLTGLYKTYRLHLLDRYQIGHSWLESGCAYRGVEQAVKEPGIRSRLYIGQDIVERQGKTWLRFSETALFDFDPWVRSVTWVSKTKGTEGQPKEVGYIPLCFESWWNTSHYLRVRMQRRTLAELETVFTEAYPEGEWRNQTLNGLHWRVQRVPLTQLRPRPLNGLGGPYQSWLVALGDTGYAMAFEMGASKESMENPSAHAAIESVLHQLVNSLQVQRLTP